MALIVEDGTGLANAEALCSVATADAYHSARAATAWAALSTGAKEAALRKATDFLGQLYRMRWAGVRHTSTQALDWPRYGCPKRDAAFGAFAAYYSSTAVPVEVANACAELALKASTSDLAADLGQTVTEQTVGPITTKYAAGSTAVKRYLAVDRMLGPLLADSGGQMRLVRA